MYLENAALFYGGFELGKHSTSLSCIPSHEILENTTFGCETRSFTKGLKTVSLASSGLADSSFKVGLSMLDDTKHTPLTFAHNAQVGDTCYLITGGSTSFTETNTVGELIKFDLDMFNESALYRGSIVLIERESANATGSALPFSSGTKLALNAHVLHLHSDVQIHIEFDISESFDNPTVIHTLDTFTQTGGTGIDIEGTFGAGFYRAVLNSTNPADAVVALAIK